jgi:hypothetical protein
MASPFHVPATALLLGLARAADAARPHTVNTPAVQATGAESAYVDAAACDQGDATVQGDLGVIHLLAGEFDLAANPLANSRTLEAHRPSIAFLLGLARHGQRRVDEGRALLKQVPSSDPYNRTAQQRLKELER